MAGATINGSTGNEYIDAKVVWSSTPNPITNKSTVTAALYYKRNNTGFTTQGTGSFSITIDGVKTNASKTLNITEYSWVKAVEATVIVSHDTDGSRSITISASGSISGTTLTSTSVSGTAVLDTIPRASSIDSLFCATKYFNGKLTYKYTPKTSTYYNRCNISLNLDGEFISVKSVLLGKQSASQKTATVTFTEDELSTIYNKLPKTDKGTLRFTFRTYSDSDYTAQIGDHAYKEISLYIPDISATKPTATMTLTPVTSLESPFDSLYIKGRSKVDANFTKGEGKYGADIVSYKMSVAGKTYGSPYTSGYLSTAGEVTVTGTVTDSRGFSQTYTKTITVIPYSEPKIIPVSGEKSIICERCDAYGNLTESGTYLKVRARRSYSMVESGDTQNNFCIIRYRVRKESDSSYSAWKTILDKTAASDTVDVNLANVVPSAETAYFVQLGVVDDIGNVDAVQVSVPSDFVTIDVPEKHKGKRIGLLRYAQDSDEPGIDLGGFIHGGGVDNLTLGDMITATSTAPIDLNDIKTPGCYYSPSGDNSKYIANSPYTTGGFGLEVRELQSTNYIRQTLYYGRTNWTRHWDTTEWSGWVRTLMTSEVESFAEDFVIEAGEKNGWLYKKWKSGTFEMFGRFTVTATADGVAYGNMYYSEQFALPTPFACSYAVVSGSATSWFIPITGGLASNNDPQNHIGFRLFRPTAFAVGAESSVRLHVTGEYVK
jgi:hypothetical protein